MKKSTKRPAALTTASDAESRSTQEGTMRFADRFRDRFAADFFRPSSLGLTVSSIGLGTYLGDNTEEDDAAYVASARHAIANGINLIDTAINYRCQRSERALCLAIQESTRAGDVLRNELVICSKGGYIPLDRTPPPSRAEYQAYVRREFLDTEILQAGEIVGGGHSLAPRFIRYCVAKSRQNLGLRSIDLYYIHNPEQQLGSVEADELYARLAAAFAVLEEAAERGEIAYYGIATWDGLRVSPDEPGHLSLERVVEAAQRVGGARHHLRGVQLPINLAMLQAVRTPTQLVGGRVLTVLQAADALDLTVIGSATLMQAKLTSGLPPALRDHFPKLTTDAQRAIAFARQVDGITASLVGMKHIAHVDDDLAAGMM
jgi:aryl-alcohol dehydrogenase-like predicted oxidoreductase